MLQWILIGVIVVLALFVWLQARFISRLKKYNDEIFEEKWQEQDEHNQELDERQKSHEEEFSSTLKEIARSCFHEFFYLYYNDLDLDKSESTNNAVKKTFSVLMLQYQRYFSDEELLEYLRQEYSDHFKGVKVKVPSFTDMFDI